MRALFIGLGGVGQRHLRLLKEMYPDAEVAAVRTRRRIFEIDDDLKVNKNIDQTRATKAYINEIKDQIIDKQACKLFEC